MSLASIQKKLNKHFEKLDKKYKEPFTYPPRTPKDIADCEAVRFEPLKQKAMKSRRTKSKNTKFVTWD